MLNGKASWQVLGKSSSIISEKNKIRVYGLFFFFFDNLEFEYYFKNLEYFLYKITNIGDYFFNKRIKQIKKAIKDIIIGRYLS